MGLMKLRKGKWFLIVFNLMYIIAFGAYYVSIKNYEFLWYVGVLVFFFMLIGLTLHKSKFDYLILWGLSLWGLMHMAGGGVRVGGGVLYAIKIIPLINSGELVVLRFDQFVHFFGFGVSTLVAYHLLSPYLNAGANYKIIYPLLAAVGMGLGALNEIVEFTAVLSFPKTGVGGYYNTALDLVFNMLGAITAIFVIHARRKKEFYKHHSP